ncbi:MAG: peptidoglycan-binding domain-containing protein [Actinomycetota bacterium]
MKAKLMQSNLLPMGVISAMISLGAMLGGGLPVQAQTNSSQMNGDTTQMNGGMSPMNDGTSPMNNGTSPMNNGTNQMNSSPAPMQQPLNQSNPSSTPSQQGSLNNYSVDRAPILSYGSEGDSVRDVQSFLSQRGFYQGQIDGVFGVETSNAVRQFQQSNNLNNDGVIGPETWEAMINVSNQASNF